MLCGAWSQSSSQARPWSFMDQWRRRISLGWWVSLDSWVMNLWLCCCETLNRWWWWLWAMDWWVSMLLWSPNQWCCIVVKPRLVAVLLWSLDRRLCCAFVKPKLLVVVVGPHSEASSSSSQTFLIPSDKSPEKSTTTFLIWVLPYLAWIESKTSLSLSGF